MSNCTTIEYVLHRPQPALNPIFLFVIDTTVTATEFEFLKESLLQAQALLPDNAEVGIVTFGKNVHVHELNFEECPKAHVIRGKKAVEVPKVAALLGMGPQMSDEQKRQYASRFIVPTSNYSEQIEALIEDLTRDVWPVAPDCRPESCAGTAFAVAIGLLESAFRGHNARIMTFMGNAPTIGPGTVVGAELKQSMRSHYDLQKGNAPNFNAAVKYYETLADRCRDNAHVFDIYGCTFDQTGAAEMKSLPERTGGNLIIDDSFDPSVGQQFSGSIRQSFNRKQSNNASGDDSELAMCFGATTAALTSRELKVCGAIGVSAKMDRKSASVSENEIGIGGTCQWVVGGMNPSTTLALYFEVANKGDDLKDGRPGYIQLVTQYRTANSNTVLRVTTVARNFASLKTEAGLNAIRAGFDQEAAASLMARYAVFRADNEYALDILPWLDRCLIRLASRLAVYQSGDPNSLRFPKEMAFFPRFMFHLRRSPFLQVFNSAPDETAYFRLVLCRENAVNALLMIQPSLMAYMPGAPPAPQNLDVESCKPDRILVLDSFFQVIVSVGKAAAQWRQNKIWETNPEYGYLKEFFDIPVNEAKQMFASRFPSPRFVLCEEGDSQSRFLMAKLNPSVTHHSGDGSATAGVVLTDDVSLKVFMDCLKKLAVKS
jgi:protein transport protein SEC23